MSYLENIGTDLERNVINVGDTVRLKQGELSYWLKNDIDYLVTAINDNKSLTLEGPRCTADQTWGDWRFDVVKKKEIPVKFKAGDKVKVVQTAIGLTTGNVYTVVDSDQHETSVLGDRGKIDAWRTDRFELVKEDKVTAPMNLETARAQRQRIIEALGVDAKDWRIRTRSWDNDASMYAVVSGPLFPNETTKLYTIKNVTEYIDANTVVDVLAKYDAAAREYVFTIDGDVQRRTLQSLNWTDGFHHKDGKKYRIGTFMPVVAE